MQEDSHWNGVSYHNNASFQYKVFMSLIDRISFSGKENILDIGCGDGKVSKELAARVRHGLVLGIDSSNSMITFARKTYGEQENLGFYLKDVQDFNLQNCFDIVASSFCLHWVPNKLKAFEIIYNALKPNGRAILAMPFRNQIIAKIRKKLTFQKKWLPYFSNYQDPSDYAEDNQYEKYATKVGFSIQSYETEEVELLYPNRDTLKNFLGTITPNTSKLPNQAEKDLFLEELIEQYLKIVPPKVGNSGYKLTYTCAKLVANKKHFENII